MSQTELLGQFVQEARDCLEVIGQRLLEIEKAPQETDLLNDLFRQVHTLKGNCGLFEFPSLERVVHAGEDLLDQIRHGKLAYQDAIGDLLLEAMDFTAEMVEDIERHGQISAQANPRSKEIADRLRLLLTTPASSPSTPPPPPNDPIVEPVNTAIPKPDWVDQINAAALSQYGGAVAWRYRPEPECFFKGEDPWRLATQTPGLKNLDVRAVEPWPQNATDLDCYRCNLELIGISDAPLAYLVEHFRYVPEQVEFFELNAASETVTTTDNSTSSSAPPISRLEQRSLEIWDEQIHILTQTSCAPGTVQAVRRVLSHLLRIDRNPASATAFQSLQDIDPACAAHDLGQWAQANRLGSLANAAMMAKPETSKAGALASSSIDSDPNRTSAPSTPHDDPTHGKVLKVAQEKIDRLMDLIGEMVVAKNALPYLAQRAETVFQQRELSREIKAQYAVINRIAEDMQHAIMQVRMMPVGTIFQRFGRLVRDISKKQGKEVHLLVEGEDTEADKNIIEALADPLIHILRNSLDHGIELPEDRKLAGKPAYGTIRVSAHQESDRVIIEISDDGQGIDPQKVRTKAIERALLDADKAATLSDQDAMQLVFLPGFSTAETISDLSGRGVGMDVVRTAIERVNGDVQLSSQVGQGTLIRLSLPLSMAVTNVMIIEAAGSQFGIPMDLIVETVRVHADDIHHFKQAHTTVLRGRIVPLKSLHELLALPTPAQINEEGEHAVLVVRMGNDNIGLLVDQFHGATDIILKPLEGVLMGMTAFSGTALMGDGSVLMILNPKELLS